MLLPSPWIDHSAGIPSAIATEPRRRNVPTSSRATLEYTAARDVAVVAVFAVDGSTCKCQNKKNEDTALWWDSNQRGKYSTASLKHGPPKADIRLVRIRVYIKPPEKNQRTKT